ncbi:Tyrosine-protein phosphatase [Halioglobus japonicus]|nr:Tyrosine-protein phosphatase [Halioglobus japonicus]
MLELISCLVEHNEDKNYVIRWRSATPGQKVTIYMSDDPEHFYSGRPPGLPVAETNDEVVLVENPDKATRHYFLLAFENGSHFVSAERRLTLQGAPNFRDLGGYQAHGGRHLKWGRIYRSSKLSVLSATDIDYVRRLGIKLICDFRQAVEQELEPTQLGDDSDLMIANLPISPGSSQSFMAGLYNGVIDVQDSAAFMETMNRELVATQMPRYASMFEYLLTHDQRLLLHCASGKDRTGFGAALILDVLGVEEDDIVTDYLLTNACLPLDEELERLSSQVTDASGSALGHDILRPMLEVRPEYILACFKEIRERYTSKQAFYQAALGLNEAKIALLRDHYLH